MESNMTYLRGVFVTIALVFLVAPTGHGQTQYRLALALGGLERDAVLGEHGEIVGTTENIAASKVLERLRETPIVMSGLALPYRVAIVADEEPNASCGADGAVYVNWGMMPVLRNQPGLWAAVLGHEIAHARLGHQVQSYLLWVSAQETAQALNAAAQNGNSAAAWVALGYSIGQPLLSKKMSRDREHEADRMGTLILAQAGYHPDFVFVLHRRMAREGDNSKFSAFFSTHPRWTTRDERTTRVYDEALQGFESWWPDSAASPGGLPPPVGFIEGVRLSARMPENSLAEEAAHRVAKVGKSPSVVLEVSYRVRNITTAPLGLVAYVFDKRGLVKAAEGASHDREGYFSAIWRLMPPNPKALEGESVPVLLEIPRAALLTKQRKVTAKVCITTATETLDCGGVKIKLPRK